MKTEMKKPTRKIRRTKADSKKKTVIICSSATFYRQVIEVRDLLKRMGFKVLVPLTAGRMEKAGDYNVGKVKTWLKLVDFDLEKHTSILYGPPINHKKTYQRLQLLEGVGRQCLPFLGGVYVLLARAKVVPLTPIRLKWKQQLSGIRITPPMPGHIARQIK